MPRSATSFKPGQSGNPGGKTKASKEVGALARLHTTAAIGALVRGLADSRTRVYAAVALLDRGYGKPAQAIEHSGGLNITGGIDAPPRPETVEEWLARRRAELAEMGATGGREDTRH